MHTQNFTLPEISDAQLKILEYLDTFFREDAIIFAPPDAGEELLRRTQLQPHILFLEIQTLNSDYKGLAEYTHLECIDNKYITLFEAMILPYGHKILPMLRKRKIIQPRSNFYPSH